MSNILLRSQLTMKESYTLAELARASKTPPRTIRFYIARGIMAGPSQAGRNATYGREHVERLEAICGLKKEGLTLTEIAHRLSPDPSREDIPAPSVCHTYAVSEDVTVLVRADIAPWRMNRIRKMLTEFAAQLRKESEYENGKS